MLKIPEELMDEAITWLTISIHEMLEKGGNVNEEIKL